jgi:hypothetical protein
MPLKSAIQENDGILVFMYSDPCTPTIGIAWIHHLTEVVAIAMWNQGKGTILFFVPV